MNLKTDMLNNGLAMHSVVLIRAKETEQINKLHEKFKDLLTKIW